MIEVLEPERMWTELDDLFAGAYRAAGWITPTDYLYARQGEPVPALSTYGALGWRPPAR